MVIERFYDSNIDYMPGANLLNALTYKVLHAADFSLVRYSLSHFADFVRGMHQLIELFENNDAPVLIRSYLHRAKDLLNKKEIQDLRQFTGRHQIQSYTNHLLRRLCKGSFQSPAF